MRCFKNSKIYIDRDDIRILDFDGDWKLILTPREGEAYTIYDKQKANNMTLEFAEYVQDKDKIILCGIDKDHYIIQKHYLNGNMCGCAQTTWDKGDVKSTIYRVDKGVYGINVGEGFDLIYPPDSMTPQNFKNNLCEYYFEPGLEELRNAKVQIEEIVPGSYLEVGIHYNIDTIRALCSLEEKSKLKYYPFVISDRTQQIIELGESDKPLYLNTLISAFTKTPYAMELAQAITLENQAQEEKIGGSKQLIKKKMEQIKNKI